MLFLKISSKNKNPVKNSMIILLHYLFSELYTLVLLPPLLLRRGTKKVPFKEGAFC